MDTPGTVSSGETRYGISFSTFSDEHPIIVVVAAVILGVFTSISDFSLYQVVDLFTSWVS